MKAIVLHMAFAMGGRGGASDWHQRCTFAPRSPPKPQTSAWPLGSVLACARHWAWGGYFGSWPARPKAQRPPQPHPAAL